MDTSFRILTSAEENKLTNAELLKYYSCLREYLLSTEIEDITYGSLGICSKANPIIRKILEKFCGYEIVTIGNEKINGMVGIYANTHQSKYDHINLIVGNPNHTIILNSIVLSPFYKGVIGLNGVKYVNKQSRESKNSAKLDMMRLLLRGKSITIFPESAWNLSPNKLHLPLYIGMIDMARKTGIPIIPVVQEYIYDDRKLDGIQRIEKVFTVYGDPIFVDVLDDPFEKLEEYSEAISTIRWHLMQQRGIFERSTISNEEYTNFIRGNIRNLKNAGVDIEMERKGIFGANDDFYLFHPINDVEFDDNSTLLSTKYVRKLIKIYDENYLKDHNYIEKLRRAG